MHSKPNKVLLLLHGFMEDKNMWNPLLTAIPDYVEVYNRDLPGHGSNPLKFKPFIPEIAADIWKEINQQYPNPQIIIIAHSMGGYVAAELFRIHPEKIIGICFVHSTSTADYPEKKANRLRAIEALEANKELYIGAMIRSLFSDENKIRLSSQIDSLIAEANKMDAENIKSCLLAMRNRNDHSKFITQTSIPIAYLLGDTDSRLPLSEMQNEINSGPHVSSHVLVGVGHMSQWENPNGAIDFLSNWLKQFKS